MKKLLKFISLLSSRQSEIFVFLRAQLSSQMATIVDNSIAFTIKKILDILKIKSVSILSRGIDSYVVATVLGQICGGFFICFINYKWTFKSLNVKFRFVIIKFALVWLVSVFLNTFFTFLITEYLKEQKFIANIFGSNNSDDIFIFAKLFVAVIVGFVWNFLMYKHFVYKDVAYKKFIGKVIKKRENQE